MALSSLLMVVTWIAGRATRERRRYARRAAEQLVDHAASEERLRIARELHDIVAHSMSLIAVKAAVANHVADERPQETREALRIIETTSRQALAEMRRTLGLLRTEPSYAPSPGLAGLRDLVDRATAAGVAASLEGTGDDGALPDGVALAGYRIVQESLTNVVRHAGKAECRVAVAVADDRVEVAVSDHGSPPSTPAGNGSGLVGMRERVSVYGGQFSAGPTTDGFTVTACLPLAEGRP